MRADEVGMRSSVGANVRRGVDECLELVMGFRWWFIRYAGSRGTLIEDFIPFGVFY
jgi:hypothetical protein